MLEALEKKEVLVTDVDCSWDRTLVMASEPDDKGFRIGLFFVDKSDDQWVTWTIGPEGNTFWGHYYRTRRRAIKDYLGRCEESGVEA